MIYVVGCVHDIQSSDPVQGLEGSPEVKQQRDHFCHLLEGIFSEARADLVTEEWGRKSESFAQILKKKLGFRYVPINTTDEDLDGLGIPGDYMVLGRYTEEQRREWLRLRERTMLEKIRSARGAAESVVVICGFDHLQAFAEDLGKGEIVKQVDYKGECWYRHDVFFPPSF
jgi:hypothetical protein